MNLQSLSLARIVRWAQEHPAVEVTGFVSRGADGELVVPMRNVHPDPAHNYAWDKEEMRTQWSAMDVRNHEPVVIYHSHPGGLQEPSEVDMLTALMPGLHYLIVFPSGNNTWGATAWECIDMGVLVGADMVLVP